MSFQFKMRSGDRGGTLLGVIVMGGIGLVLLFATQLFLANSLRFNIGADRRLSAEASKSMLRVQVTQLIAKSLFGNVFYNDGVAARLGLGANLGWLTTPEVAAGSLLVGPGRVLASPVGTQAGPANLHILAVILADTSVPALTTNGQLTFSDAESTVGGVKSIVVNSPPTGYVAGDVVALVSPIGSEFFVLTINPVGNTLSLMCEYGALPSRLIAPATSLFRVQAVFIGADAVTGALRIVQFRPGSAAYVERFSSAITPTLLQVHAPNDPLNINSGAPLGMVSLLARKNGSYLRIQWPDLSFKTPSLHSLDMGL